VEIPWVLDLSIPLIDETYQRRKPGGPGNLLPGCEAQEGYLLPSAPMASSCSPAKLLVVGMGCAPQQLLMVNVAAKIYPEPMNSVLMRVLVHQHRQAVKRWAMERWRKIQTVFRAPRAGDYCAGQYLWNPSLSGQFQGKRGNFGPIPMPAGETRAV
jgi:hypothetical protein